MTDRLRCPAGGHGAQRDFPFPVIRACARLERYATEVESYVQGVNQAIAAMEARWGEDRDAWRIVLRALAAHGGRERIRKQTALTE